MERKFPEDKFSPSSMRRIGDPAGGMFDVDPRTGLPVGQALAAGAGMSVKKAMDFVKAVREGKIDPNPDEGMRETFNMALYNSQGQPVAAPAAAPVAEAPSAGAERPNLPFFAQGDQYGGPQGLRDAPPAVVVAKRAIPMPPTRPSDLPREEPGILSRIFSGKDYQSNSRPVMEDETVNWGNPDSAADFFRADKARMAMEGRASGGSVNGKPDKDAALHKALEIIHHMIRSR
jgi:hypothetical protein